MRICCQQLGLVLAMVMGIVDKFFDKINMPHRLEGSCKVVEEERQRSLHAQKDSSASRILQADEACASLGHAGCANL